MGLPGALTRNNQRRKIKNRKCRRRLGRDRISLLLPPNCLNYNNNNNSIENINTNIVIYFPKTEDDVRGRMTNVRERTASRRLFY